MVHLVSGEAAGSRTQSAFLFVSQTFIWQRKDERITFLSSLASLLKTYVLDWNLKLQTSFWLVLLHFSVFVYCISWWHTLFKSRPSGLVHLWHEETLNAPDNRTGWSSSVKHLIHSSVHHVYGAFHMKYFYIFSCLHCLCLFICWSVNI